MNTLAAILPPLVYLDSIFVIYAFEGSRDYGTAVQALLRDLDLNVYSGLTSELTLAEVLEKPFKDGNIRLEQLYRANVRTSKSLRTVSISQDILIEAARIRSKISSFKLPDAIHAATALLNGCTTFLTNDRRFESVAGLPVVLLSSLA